MAERPPLTKDLLIQDAVEYYPEIVPVFFEYGLACVGCFVSGMETIEQGARGHGMSDQEITNMLLDAIDVIEKKGSQSSQPAPERSGEPHLS